MHVREPCIQTNQRINDDYIISHDHIASEFPLSYRFSTLGMGNILFLCRPSVKPSDHVHNRQFRIFYVPYYATNLLHNSAIFY